MPTFDDDGKTFIRLAEIAIPIDPTEIYAASAVENHGWGETVSAAIDDHDRHPSATPPRNESLASPG